MTSRAIPSYHFSNPPDGETLRNGHATGSVTAVKPGHRVPRERGSLAGALVAPLLFAGARTASANTSPVFSDETCQNAGAGVTVCEDLESYIENPDPTGLDTQIKAWASMTGPYQKIISTVCFQGFAYPGQPSPNEQWCSSPNYLVSGRGNITDSG